MNHSIDQDWQDWINANQTAIDAGFERDFVLRVLSKIPFITPNDLIAQYEFKDNTHRNRRIDFVIQNEEKGLFLAIELDGARRGEQELQAQWADFLQRQNDLLENVGPLLRFSNSQMFKDSAEIIRRITYSLERQIKEKRENDLLESNINRMTQSLQQLEDELQQSQTKIATLLSSQNSTSNQQENNASQTEIEALKMALADAKKEEQQLKTAYDAKESRLQSIDSQLHQQRIAQLEAAQRESDAKLIAQNRDTQLMIRTMASLAVIILCSMGVILYIFLTDRPASNDNPIAQAATIEHGADFTHNPSETPTDGAKKVGVIKKIAYQHRSTPLLADQITYNVGKEITYCGVIAQKTDFSKGIYLNYDKHFPNQSLTIVIWEEMLAPINAKMGGIDRLLNKKVCVFGEVTQYKDRYQIRATPQTIYFQ